MGMPSLAPRFTGWSKHRPLRPHRPRSSRSWSRTAVA